MTDDHDYAVYERPKTGGTSVPYGQGSRRLQMTVTERLDGLIDVRIAHEDGTCDVTVPLEVSGAEELARMLTTVAEAIRSRGENDG